MNFLLESSTLPIFLTCKNLFVGFTLAFNYLFRWPLWYRVLSRNHVVVLYAYKNDMSTHFTLNPQLSISLSLNHGFKNRTGPAGPIGSTGNRPLIRSGYDKKPEI